MRRFHPSDFFVAAVRTINHGFGFIRHLGYGLLKGGLVGFFRFLSTCSRGLRLNTFAPLAQAHEAHAPACFGRSRMSLTAMRIMVPSSVMSMISSFS